MATLTESLSKFNVESQLFKQQPTFTEDEHSLINNFRAWDYLTLFDNVVNSKYSKQYKTQRLYTSFNLETLEYNESATETVEHNIMPICIHRRDNHFYMESYTHQLFDNIFKDDIKNGKKFTTIPIKEEYYNQFHQTLLVINHETNQATYYNPNGFHNHFYNSDDEIKNAITSCLESFLCQFFQKILPKIDFQFHEKNEEFNQEFTFPEIRYDFDDGQNFLLTFLLGHLLDNGLSDVKSFYSLVNQLSDIGKAELIYNFASTICKEFNPDNTPEDETKKSLRGSPIPFEKDDTEDYDSIEDIEDVISQGNPESIKDKEDEKSKEIRESLEKAKSLFSEIDRLQKILEQLNK